MAGIIIPVSLTTEQANLIMELIKRRVQIIEGIHKEAGVMTDETKKQRDDLRDLGNWIWDILGTKLKRRTYYNDN